MKDTAQAFAESATPDEEVCLEGFQSVCGSYELRSLLFIHQRPTCWMVKRVRLKNLSFRCSLGFSLPPVDPISGPFLVEKE